MSSSELRLFEQRASAAEQEIAGLKKELDSLLRLAATSAASGGTTTNQVDNAAANEIEELKKENEKLKMRINILKRTRDERKSKQLAMQPANHSNLVSVYDSLTALFEDAITRAWPNLVDPPVVVSSSSNPKFGDYQCNSALPLCKLLSGCGGGGGGSSDQKKPKLTPRDVAEKVLDNVKLPSPLVDRLEIAGAGFINVYLKREFAANALGEMLIRGRVEPPPTAKKLKVIVDFSSPNVAKEMHVGHLRSTIIGESISRLLEYLGHDVLRLNHIGDWGTQFGMLIAHLEDKFPDYATESPPISDLQSFYKESKVRFDEDEAFKRRAYETVVKLQARDPKIIRGWKLICDVSRREFQNIYDRLDVDLVERGESFYQERMEKLVQDLQEHGFLEEDEGRKIMWGETGAGAQGGGQGIPLTIVKRDGGFTYDTSDMAAIKQRIVEEKADWVIYVTDAGQATHFSTIVSCAKRCRILGSRHRIDHVGFGVVLGEDGKKFKTRSGDTVKLAHLLDEGLRRAEGKLRDKERDKHLGPEEFIRAKEHVAYGCIKYADLCHNRNHEYVFSFDKMLEDKGNTAVYLLYALTRIRSIARAANLGRDQIREAAKTTAISLEHEREWKLAKVLVKFPDVIAKITRELAMHSLCEFCYEIACTFTEFYDKCYCVERDGESGQVVRVNMGRILLTEATAMMLEQCFALLGLKPVEKM